MEYNTLKKCESCRQHYTGLFPKTLISLLRKVKSGWMKLFINIATCIKVAILTLKVLLVRVSFNTDKLMLWSALWWTDHSSGYIQIVIFGLYLQSGEMFQVSNISNVMGSDPYVHVYSTSICDMRHYCIGHITLRSVAVSFKLQFVQNIHTMLTKHVLYLQLKKFDWGFRGEPVPTRDPRSLRLCS